MKKRQSVMIGIPTMTNRITIQIVGVLDALRQASKDPDAAFDVHFLIEVAKSPVEYARNVLVGAFLKSDCDKLWFIDEDMLPDSSVARLLHSDADITCARMYKFDHPNPAEGKEVGLGLCAMTKIETNLYRPLAPSLGDTAIQECDAVGTACTIINRRVLEDRRLWTDNIYTTVDGKTIDGNVPDDAREYAPAVFRYPRGPNGVGIMGEDIDFCVRAKALGYSIKVDLNAVCGHWKSIDIDQAGFLAQKTVERVMRGIQLEDGRVLQVDLKSALAPMKDKAVHAGDFAVKDVA